jgi:hypothetical protein
MTRAVSPDGAFFVSSFWGIRFVGRLENPSCLPFVKGMGSEVESRGETKP